MIRLHVLDDQIVGRASSEGRGQVVQPFMGKMDVHRVHYGDLLIQDHIGIIGHSVGNNVLSFKKVHLMVVDAYIADRVGNCVHISSSIRVKVFDRFTA